MEREEGEGRGVSVGATGDGEAVAVGVVLLKKAVGAEEMVAVGKGREERRGPTEVVPPPILLPVTLPVGGDTLKVPPPFTRRCREEGEGEAVTRPGLGVCA